MDRGAAGSVLREIRTLYTLGTMGGRTDAELLERFLARGETTPRMRSRPWSHRHGPMVLGVCRRMLPASHDAEDAFQATFLVLARGPRRSSGRERLASWLYGVAVRIAKEARRRAVAGTRGGKAAEDVSRVESEPPEDRDDLIPILDEELNRLPHRYRAALLACELEGKSRREAAEQFGIPEGTLSTHLARGRKMLRERLHGAASPRGRADRGAGSARRRSRGPRAADRPDGPGRPGHPSGAGTAVGLGGGLVPGGKGAQDDVPRETDLDRRGSDDDGRGSIHRGRARLVHDGGGTPERRAAPSRLGYPCRRPGGRRRRGRGGRRGEGSVRRAVARRHRGPARDPVRRGRPATGPDRRGSTFAPGQTPAAGTSGQGHRHRPRGGTEGPAGLGRAFWSCSLRGGGRLAAAATPGPPGTCGRPSPTPTVTSGSSSL